MDPALKELIDRQQIRDLIEGYSSAVNFKQWDRMAQLFDEDGVWSVKGAHTDREVRGRAEVKREISSVVEPFDFCFQVPGAVRIEIDGDTATATSSLQDYIKVGSEPDIILFGFYHDQFVRRDDGWKFARRDYRGRYFGRDPLTGETIPLVQTP